MAQRNMLAATVFAYQRSRRGRRNVSARFLELARAMMPRIANGELVAPSCPAPWGSNSKTRCLLMQTVNMPLNFNNGYVCGSYIKGFVSPTPATRRCAVPLVELE